MGAVHTAQERGSTFAGYSTLETTVCGVCGVLFAMPQRMLQACKWDGETFYCPHGHSLVFTDSDKDKVLRERDKALRRLEAQKDSTARVQAELDQTEASRRAFKGQATKLKKRAAGGVCPCCNRTFKELARHMKSKHPDFVAGADRGETK